MIGRYPTGVPHSSENHTHLGTYRRPVPTRALLWSWGGGVGVRELHVHVHSRNAQLGRCAVLHEMQTHTSSSSDTRSPLHHPAPPPPSPPLLPSSEKTRPVIPPSLLKQVSRFLHCTFMTPVGVRFMFLRSYETSGRAVLKLRNADERGRCADLNVLLPTRQTPVYGLLSVSFTLRKPCTGVPRS